jgi:hypothetical protein
MKDDFLSEYREAPRPEFARALRERINNQAPLDEGEGARPRIARWTTALAGAAALALVVLTFNFPGARATARDFLDLFRVKRFAAIPIDPERIAQLRAGNIDFKTLLSDDIQVLEEPGKPQLVDSVEAAGRLAGIDARIPTVLPYGTSQPEIHVKGNAAARLTADTAKLQTIMESLDIYDVKVPEGLNGATVEVTVPPSITLQYKRGLESVVFVQSRSPQIDLPEGVDLAQLGEIGLRIAGLSPAEAHAFAQSVDWHSTLLVPVPANAASFREVNVQGTTALLITTGGTGGLPKRGPNGERQRSIVLWSEGDMVYAVMGEASSVDLVEMANSIQ